MKLLVASKNRKKIAEMVRILSPLGLEPIGEADIGITLPDVEETGATFAENAYLKAKSACESTGIPAVADDSGLCVDALDGAPGVYSARYSGDDANDEKNNEKLLCALNNVKDDERTAAFVSHICVVFPNGDTVTAEGKVDGYIARTPHGQDGFGYDPLFMVNGVSFAEMTAAEKDAISHRGRALTQLKVKLEEYFNDKQ